MLLLTILLYEFSAKMVANAFLMLFAVAYPALWAEIKCNEIVASELEILAMIFKKSNKKPINSISKRFATLWHVQSYFQLDRTLPRRSGAVANLIKIFVFHRRGLFYSPPPTSGSDVTASDVTASDVTASDVTASKDGAMYVWILERKHACL